MSFFFYKDNESPRFDLEFATDRKVQFLPQEFVADVVLMVRGFAMRRTKIRAHVEIAHIMSTNGDNFLILRNFISIAKG